MEDLSVVLIVVEMEVRMDAYRRPPRDMKGVSPKGCKQQHNMSSATD